MAVVRGSTSVNVERLPLRLQQQAARLMKKIKDTFNMDGSIEEIAICEFRDHPGEVLNQVELGKVFVLKRHGKALAVLSKVPGINLSIIVDTQGKVSYDL